MAGNGPAPTPTAILTARGSKVANSRDGEPALPVGAPPIPHFIEDMPSAREAWTFLTTHLVAAGVLAEVDQHALAMFCSTWARWRRAQDVLEFDGETYEAKTFSDKGELLSVKILPRPESAIATTLLAELRQQGDRLGMNPAARTRLRVSKPAGGGKHKPWQRLNGGQPALPATTGTASPSVAAAP